MGDNRSSKKIANSLVAVSSAAVLAVYAAGYTRTRAAAERFGEPTTERRPHLPVQREPGGRVADATLRPGPAAAAAPATTQPTLDIAQPAVTERTEKKAREHAPRVASNAATAPAPAPAPEPPAAAPAAASAAPAVAAAAPPAPAAATPAPAAPSNPASPGTSKYKDGTYLGWGTSRHGDIQAAVVVESGRITAARVEQCLTRYSCAWVAPIPPVILKQQGTTYDYVSGATESSDAFQDAIADALSHAQ